MKNKSLTSVFLLAILLISACGAPPGEMTIQNAWARPAASGDNGAAYFIIENGAGFDDTLLSVSSDIAVATEIHMSMMMDSDMMTMQEQESVDVPDGKSVEFKPGGLHVMFVELNQDLKVGDTFMLILRFENAGEIKIQVEVKE